MSVTALSEGRWLNEVGSAGREQYAAGIEGADGFLVSADIAIFRWQNGLAGVFEYVSLELNQ
jgi:hypothetical protein